MSFVNLNPPDKDYFCFLVTFKHHIEEEDGDTDSIVVLAPDINEATTAGYEFLRDRLYAHVDSDRFSTIFSTTVERVSIFAIKTTTAPGC